MSAAKKVSPVWTRLDVSIVRSSRVQQLAASGPEGFKAFMIYVESICWSAENLSDGMLPEWYRPTIARPDKATALLESGGLWLQIDDVMKHGLPGEDDPPLARARWLVRNYLDYGVTRAEWQALTNQRKIAAAGRWAKKPPTLRGVQ